MAGTSNNGDLSIVGDGVIEVYEVEEGGLQECMFVEKFSETSLSKLNDEKSTLQEKLQASQEKIKLLRGRMKENDAEQDIIAANNKAEKDNLQTSLNSANQKLKQQESALAKATKENTVLKQKNADINKSASEVKKKLSTVNSECDKLRGEIKRARQALTQAEKHAAEQQKNLFEEKAKTSKEIAEMEDKMMKWQQSLRAEQKKMSVLEEERCEEVNHLLDRLRKEKEINKTLSQEAEFTIAEMKKKLQVKENENAELIKVRDRLTKETRDLDAELLELKEKCEEEKKSREKNYKGNELQIQELKQLLQQRTKDCEEMEKWYEKEREDTCAAKKAKAIAEMKLQNAEKEIGKIRAKIVEKTEESERHFFDEKEKLKNEMELLKQNMQKHLQKQKHCEALKFEAQKLEMQKQLEDFEKEKENFSSQFEMQRLDAEKKLEVQKFEAKKKIETYKLENKKLKDAIRKFEVEQIHAHERVTALKCEESVAQENIEEQAIAEAPITEARDITEVGSSWDKDEPTSSKQGTSATAHEQDRGYFQLKADFLMLEKQLKQVKKHRNEVLRENNDLRHHINIATVQLAARNGTFQQQIEFFRNQLEAGEHLYQEKLLECQILETQLQHVLKNWQT